MKKFSYDVTEPHVSMDSLELYEIIVDPDDCKCHMCLVLNQLISEVRHNDLRFVVGLRECLTGKRFFVVE